MNSSRIYFHNFDLIDPKKKSILFIPGAGMDHRFIRALNFPESEYNPPLVIDLPGHGSSHGTSCNNIQFYSKFLIELLKSYNLNNLVLCGHSMGGLIAMDMLIHHSYQAKSLILLNNIYPIKVSKFLIEKAKISNGEASSFIIKYG
ncbi:MAG: alpha/beta hydrolase, partial [Alphaproteobacteria bacterium]|nr:alpha/beta hydrolase [Alphaproteobacteria bacterium]